MDKIKIKELILELKEFCEIYIGLPLKLEGEENLYFNIMELDDGYELAYNKIDIYFHKYEFNVYIGRLPENKFKNIIIKSKDIVLSDIKYFQEKNTKLYEVELYGIPYIYIDKIKELLICV